MSKQYSETMDRIVELESFDELTDAEEEELEELYYQLNHHESDNGRYYNDY